MARKSTKVGGGKLSRTETVTVRLDPKLNYLCELASRAQRRTKSSFIEWAIEHALESVPVPGTALGFESPDLNIAELAASLWDTDEPDRLAKLAFHAPSLMNHSEQVIWKLIRENGYLWKGRYTKDNNWVWDIEPDNLIIDRLRDCWEDFVSVACGEIGPDKLPTWATKAPREFPDQDFDDEIPF